MGKLANASIIVVFLFALGAGASLPTVSADVLYYYPGPDFSPDQRFILTDFRVEGPSSPTVGDALTVTFTLTCQMPTTLGSKGVFAAVRDSDNSNRDFGTTRAGQSLKAGDVITLSSSLIVDKSGLWKIWPSYQINMTGLPISYGPDYWHSANITIAPALRPDLAVLDVVADSDNSRVGFTVANQGNATAPSSFSVRLLVGQQAFFETVPQGLAPGSQHSSWFYGYTWPDNTNITATATADYYNAVAESNEGNNALTEYLTRQAEALRITQGPTATVVDQDTVIIQWLTNLNSNSSVSYGTSKLPDRSQGNSTSTRSHYVTLEKLSAGTTYSFFVTSWDSIGHKATSKQFTFETPPPPDGQAPSLYIPPWAGNLSGIADVLPQASDEGGVDRLLFYIDGVLKFTDYSPPFSWRLNTTEHPDGTHNITVVAIDRFGNRISGAVDFVINNPEGDSRPPVVSILSPVQGEVVWGSVRIEALALDVGLYGEETGYIREAQMLIDGILTRTWVYTPFRFNPITGEMETHAPSSSMELLHFWDASMLAAGSNHTVEVRAWDDSGNMGYSIHNVSMLKLEAYVPPLEMMITDVELERIVTRHGNWFEVSLSVRNAGNVNLSGFQLTEQCMGFQMIPLPMPATSADRVRYSPAEKSCYIDFADTAGVLEGGEKWTVSYYAVPVLYEPSEGFWDPMYQIGARAYITANGGALHEEITTPYPPAFRDENFNGIGELTEAFRSSDYLIITNPATLFAFNPLDNDGVNLLLADAATLAKAKNGILGYLSSINASSDVKDLIAPGGAWVGRLGYCFQDPNAVNAFLLLIGKAEIVPAHTYDISGLDISWSNDGSTKKCRLSDNYYADTVRNDGRPDLVVGRIVGNTARDLLLPIEASLEVYMGHGTTRDQALVVSGYESSGSDVFVDLVNEMGEDLATQGLTYTAVHFSTLIENAWTVHFDEDDVFVLADVDGDGLDEAIIGRDEEDMVYIYECYPRSLAGTFGCPITTNDGFTAGDYDGDGRDEIAIAHNGEGQNGRIYIYEANGTIVGYWDKPFKDWDLIASGDLYDMYGEPHTRDEVVIGHCDWDNVYAYTLHEDPGSGEMSLHYESFDLGIDLTHYDAMAVGNLRNDTDKDEVAIARDDNSRIYVYDVFGIYGIDGANRQELSDLDDKSGNDVRYTKYDGFAAGDVNKDGEEELIVLCDEDDRMYAYEWHRSYWGWYPLYSQFWDYWFNGVYYTGGSDRHDGFGIGKFTSTGPALMVVLLNEFGDSSSFQTFAASWPEAERLANSRVEAASLGISVMAVCGHGNPWGPSPVGVAYMDYLDFANHPIVLAASCSAGWYGTSLYFSFSDALFARGAAAFIGSTEVSARTANVGFARNFFQGNWDIGSELPAVALRDWERSHFSDRYSKLWVYEYNFYGDPKFGG